MSHPPRLLFLKYKHISNQPLKQLLIDFITMEHNK
jgi:hypothetical protein